MVLLIKNSLTLAFFVGQAKGVGLLALVRGLLVGDSLCKFKYKKKFNKHTPKPNI